MRKIIDKIYNGRIFIIKKAFSIDFIKKIKDSFIDFVESQPSSFHKMTENCPNFQRIGNEKVCDWETKSGRWFIGLYSNDSDEKVNRITATNLD